MPMQMVEMQAEIDRLPYHAEQFLKGWNEGDICNVLRQYLAITTTMAHLWEKIADELLESEMKKARR